MTFRSVIGAASICAGSLSAAPLAAQEAQLDRSEVVTTINAETVKPALALVTETQLPSVDRTGSPSLIATAWNGLKFNVFFRSCEPVGSEQGAQHCKGMTIISIWDALPEDEIARFEAARARFQLDRPAINAGLLADGSPYLIRYVIADNGAPQGNLIAEFATFINAATDFQNEIVPLYPE